MKKIRVFIGVVTTPMNGFYEIASRPGAGALLLGQVTPGGETVCLVVDRDGFPTVAVGRENWNPQRPWERYPDRVPQLSPTEWWLETPAGVSVISRELVTAPPQEGYSAEFEVELRQFPTPNAGEEVKFIGIPTGAVFTSPSGERFVKTSPFGGRFVGPDGTASFEEVPLPLGERVVFHGRGVPFAAFAGDMVGMEGDIIALLEAKRLPAQEKMTEVRWASVSKRMDLLCRILGGVSPHRLAENLFGGKGSRLRARTLTNDEWSGIDGILRASGRNDLADSLKSS